MAEHQITPLLLPRLRLCVRVGGCLERLGELIDHNKTNETGHLRSQTQARL